MNKRNILIGIVLVIVVILGIYFSKSTRTPAPEPLTANYTSERYQISLFMPEGWTPIPNELDSFIGESGIIKMSALGGDGVTLEEVAFNEGAQRLKPYGSSPILGNATIDGQPAKYIYPGTDQPAETAGQSAVIVTYPKPVVISGTAYHYFILWVDQTHVQTIASTLHFLASTSTATVTQPSLGRGVLAGQVNVSPVCAVEREDQVCTPSPTLYTSQKVYVYSKRTKAQVARLPIKEDGTYRLELAAGSYSVDMSHAGIGGSDLPSDVVITAGKTVILNIDIDTGIR